MSEPKTNQRCTVHSIRLDDPEMSAQSPQLASLVNEGWSPIGHFVAERSGVPELIVFFSPPKSQKSKAIKAAAFVVIGAAIGFFITILST